MQGIDEPEWFQNHLQTPFETVREQVRDCEIQFAIWGSANKPGLVFVHGGLAHIHWWRFLAPFFTADYRVIALDISGHGDSGRRDVYSPQLWAEEIATAVKVAQFDQPPVLIGHSLGGLLGLLAAATYKDLFSGLIIVDSPVIQQAKSHAEGQRGKSYLHITPYPTLEAAKKRFRLLPDQPVGHPYLFDFLAETSLRRAPEGWIWKFDPSVFVQAKRREWPELFAEVSVPMAFIRGEKSAIATPEVRAALLQASGDRLAMVDIAQAHHHIMLDQPIAFVASLRALLATWAVSRG